MKSAPAQPNLRKAALQMAGGGVVGLIGALSVSALLPEIRGTIAPGAVALLGVGMIYGLIGLMVGLGLVLPRVGVALLNVADREDLADQRAVLTGSVITCVVLGGALMLLALSGPTGRVPDTLAAGAMIAAVIVMAAVTVTQWPLYDELMRGVSMEAAAAMSTIVSVVVMSWAMLSHFGRTGPMDPLGLIAVLAGSLLLGTFIAAGRRGLMMPPQ